MNEDEDKDRLVMVYWLAAGALISLVISLTCLYLLKS